jgi:hypothetical protein
VRRHIESNEQRDGRGVRQGNEVYGPVLDSSGAVIDLLAADLGGARAGGLAAVIEDGVHGRVPAVVVNGETSSRWQVNHGERGAQ